MAGKSMSIQYKWKGQPEMIGALIYQEDGKTLKSGLEVIGPRTLDGVSYVNIRTDQPLTLPDGAAETGPELSDAVVGIWYEPPTDITQEDA
jgi:hypothetical protein